MRAVDAVSRPNSHARIKRITNTTSAASLSKRCTAHVKPPRIGHTGVPISYMSYASPQQRCAHATCTTRSGMSVGWCMGTTVFVGSHKYLKNISAHMANRFKVTCSGGRPQRQGRGYSNEVSGGRQEAYSTLAVDSTMPTGLSTGHLCFSSRPWWRQYPESHERRGT